MDPFKPVALLLNHVMQVVYGEPLCVHEGPGKLERVSGLVDRLGRNPICNLKTGSSFRRATTRKSSRALR